jgi:hypothetical protein
MDTEFSVRGGTSCVVWASHLDLGRRAAALTADAYVGSLRTRCWLTVPGKGACSAPASTTTSAVVSGVFEQIKELSDFSSHARDATDLVGRLTLPPVSEPELFNVALVCVVIVLLQTRLWLSDAWPRALLDHLLRNERHEVEWPPALLTDECLERTNPLVYVLMTACALRRLR